MGCEPEANHGACVSARTAECPPGPGHGACVVEAAHDNAGQARKADAETDPELDADGAKASGKPTKADKVGKAAKAATAPKAGKSGRGGGR
jgi:hypothetical protein